MPTAPSSCASAGAAAGGRGGGGASAPGSSARCSPIEFRNVVDRVPDIRLNAAAGNQPSLAVFDELLAGTGVRTDKPLTPAAGANLDRLREGLLQKLPVSPELERLRIWPW